MNGTKLTSEGTHIINYVPLVEEKKKKLKELSAVSSDSLSSDIELPSWEKAQAMRLVIMA